MGSFPELYNDRSYFSRHQFPFSSTSRAVTKSLSVWIYVISQREIERLGILLVSFSFCFL